MLSAGTEAMTGEFIDRRNEWNKHTTMTSKFRTEKKVGISHYHWLQSATPIDTVWKSVSLPEIGPAKTDIEGRTD